MRYRVTLEDWAGMFVVDWQPSFVGTYADLPTAGDRLLSLVGRSLKEGWIPTRWPMRHPDYLDGARLIDGDTRDCTVRYIVIQAYNPRE